MIGTHRVECRAGVLQGAAISYLLFQLPGSTPWLVTDHQQAFTTIIQELYSREEEIRSSFNKDIEAAGSNALTE
eukprot:2128012-Heterocapsa_arctica.AAC.1